MKLKREFYYGILGAAAMMGFVSLSARAAPAGAHFCIFSLPLSPALCERVMRLRNHAPRRSWRKDRPGEMLVYASQLGDAISISSVGPHGFAPVGELSLEPYALPLGVATDAAGNLYVALAPVSSPAHAAVDVFPPGATQPSREYTDGLTAPVGVAVDRHGTVYVANLAKTAGACSLRRGSGDVVEYAKGSMKPNRIIRGFPGCPFALTVDAKSNLYVVYEYYGKTEFESDVRKYAPGATTGKRLHLQDPSEPPVPRFDGIAIDPHGNLVVAVEDSDNSVCRLLTYPPGMHRAVSEIVYAAWWTCQGFALLNDRIFAPAYTTENLNTAIAEFAYPSGRELFVQNPALAPASYFFAFAVAP